MSTCNKTIEQHTKALADYLPNGRTFEAKHITDSNLHKLLRGFAGEFFNAQGYLCLLEQDYFPDATEFFLDEWEQALGIPDQCLSGGGTFEERRRDILVKLTALGVQTAEDFITLAQIYGIDIEIKNGNEASSFDYTFDINFFGDATDGRFTIVVVFPIPEGSFFIYDFPIIFGDRTQFILQCLFNRLKPANCRVIFVNE